MNSSSVALADNPHLALWQEALRDASCAVAQSVPVRACGRLTRAVGLVLEAVGLRLPVGSNCLIELPPGYLHKTAEAEVVGFSGDRVFLMPQSEVDGLLPGARVYALESPPGRDSPSGPRTKRLPVGEGMLGRVVDAHGNPMDYKGPILDVSSVPMDRRRLTTRWRCSKRRSPGNGRRSPSTSTRSPRSRARSTSPPC